MVTSYNSNSADCDMTGPEIDAVRMEPLEQRVSPASVSFPPPSPWVEISYPVRCHVTPRPGLTIDKISLMM
jgi:hypothetical protein